MLCGRGGGLSPGWASFSSLAIYVRDSSLNAGIPGEVPAVKAAHTPPGIMPWRLR